MAKSDKSALCAGVRGECRADAAVAGRAAAKCGCGAAMLSRRRSRTRCAATRKLWADARSCRVADGALPPDFPVEYADMPDLDRLVSRDAPHQGLVLECAALEDVHLDEVLGGDRTCPIVVLDQVTDPHNLGAVMRSAAAFGAAAIVTQDRHAPPEGGVVAKSASGSAGGSAVGACGESRARARADGRGRLLADRACRRGRNDAGRGAGRPGRWR